MDRKSEEILKDYLKKIKLMNTRIISLKLDC